MRLKSLYREYTLRKVLQKRPARKIVDPITESDVDDYVYQFDSLPDLELRKKMAEAYTNSETKWQSWRERYPSDKRNAFDYSGSPEENEIGEAARITEKISKSGKYCIHHHLSMLGEQDQI